MKAPKFIFQDIYKEQQSIQTTQKQQILKIRPPKQHKKQGVMLTKAAEDILLSSFTCLILGKPGSGKSHIISEFINQKQFYQGKFDRIIYIGPTKYENCIHDSYNTSPSLDIKFIEKKINQSKGWAQNMLIIMDDVISQIPSSQKNRLQQLFFNRRHQLGEGCISIMITSQKLTSVPTWVRSTINSLIVFPITKNQLKVLFNEIPLLLNSEIILKHFQNLNRHQFVYFNLQNGKAFTTDFEQL